MTDADVQTYRAELADKQSVVEVRSGEQLTEYQALQALLIPSGNNIGDLLAVWDAGGVSAFVGRMNAKAKALKLAQTSYADTSGASEQSVSTPTDLTRLALAAVANPVLAEIVAQPEATLPVAGRVFNVDASLGQGGVEGIKTGSNPGQGAAFMFSAPLKIGGQTVTVVGAVMGLDTLDEVFRASPALRKLPSRAETTKRRRSSHEIRSRTLACWRCILAAGRFGILGIFGKKASATCLRGTASYRPPQRAPRLNRGRTTYAYIFPTDLPWPANYVRADVCCLSCLG